MVDTKREDKGFAIMSSEGLPLIASNGLAVIRVSQQLSAAYLCALLRSPSYKSWMQAYARGSGIQHLSLDALRKMPIPVPDIRLQQIVVENAQGSHQDCVEVLLDILKKPVDSPVIDWMNSSSEVRDLLNVDQARSRVDSLNLVERSARGITVVRNDIAHSAAAWQSAALTNWVLSIDQVTHNLANVSKVPEGPSRYAIVNSARGAIEALIANSGESIESAEKTAWGITRRIGVLLAREEDEMLGAIRVKFDIAGQEVAGALSDQPSSTNCE